MSFTQIALAAECITLARVDFAQKVVMEPILELAQAVVRKRPTTSSERASQAKKKKASPKVKGSTQDRAKARDEAIFGAASALGITIG